MPKDGDIIRGHFQEIIDPHNPIVWDDPPQYFDVNPTEPDRAAERERIGESLARWVAADKARRLVQVQEERKGPYFAIPGRTP